MAMSMKLTSEMQAEIVREIKGHTDLSMKMLMEMYEDSFKKMGEERLKDNQNMIFLNKEIDSFSSQKSSDAFLEEMCLRECDVCQLLKKLNDLNCDCQNACMVSSILSDFIEKREGLDVIDNLEEWDKKKRYEKIFLINPRSSYQFLTKKHLFENVMNIKDEIVFLMPCINAGSFQVIWDEGFGDIEIDNNSYYRWYIGKDHIGKIIVYNDFDCYKTVKIQFDTYTANPNARIIVKCGNFAQVLNMALDEHKFELETILVPGCNELQIVFCGEVCNLNEAELRKCQFTVTNFQVHDTEKDIVFAGKEVYQRQCDSSYSEYILSERYIRNRLHENGCFEIETLKCEADGMYPIDVTRAYVWDGGYYTLKDKDNKLLRASVDGIIHTNKTEYQANNMVLYIVRRRGKLKHER
ncbi:hypothetical protein AALB52_00350 [Lachnospiraceae bacterium 38-14]